MTEARGRDGRGAPSGATGPRRTSDRPLSVLVLGLGWPPETFIANIVDGLDPARVRFSVAAPARWRDHPPGWRPQSPSQATARQLVVSAAVAGWQALHVPAEQRGIVGDLLRERPWTGRYAYQQFSREVSALGRWDAIYFPWTAGPPAFPRVFDLGAPVIVSCRGAHVNVAPLDPDRTELRDSLHHTFERATLVHCVSDDIAAAAEPFGLEPSRARVIRPAVDASRFSPAPAATRRTDPADPFELITTGTLYWRKGTEDLLVALRRLVDTGVDARLTVIGTGKEQQRVEFCVADLGLTDRVRLLGRQTPAEVAERLRRADAFVLASLSEGISNAVLEGMASGLPVVTTVAGGMAEAVTDGEQGYLVPIGQPASMAEALRKLAADPAGAAAMGERARRRVEDDFEVGDQREAFTRLFEEAAAMGPRPAPAGPPASSLVDGGASPTGGARRRAGELAEALGDAVAVRLPHRRSGTRDHLSVMAFHEVVDPPQFAVLLDELVARATPVSIDEVLDAHAGRAPLPADAVLLTFDDGDPTIIDVALPAMQARQVPGLVFVVAGLVGTGEPFWWREVVDLVDAGATLRGERPDPARDLVNRMKEWSDADRRAAIDELRATADRPAAPARQLTAAELVALEAGGIAVGSHSLTHPILARCDDEAVAREVFRSRELLADLLGHPPRTFAYPSGRVDDRVAAAVAEAGYELGFGWDHARAPFPFPDPYRIPRLHCDAGASRGRFVLLAEGRHRSLAKGRP